MAINSGFFLLLGAEFLAIVQVLIYISGIVILIVFVIMLTNTLQNEKVDINITDKVIPIFISISLLIFKVFIILLILPNGDVEHFNFVEYSESNVARIGFQLLDINENGYVLPFEIISLLLLTSLIGCLKVSRR